MDFIWGILRSAILPAVLIAISGDLIYKVLKNIVFYNKKKQKIKDTNNEIIREMMSYIYSNKKYDKFVLTNIISGVHTLREVKLKKLYSLQEFESIILLEITKSNLISVEIKNDLYEQIKNGSLIKELSDIQKGENISVSNASKNNDNIFKQLLDNEKISLFVVLYSMIIVIMSSYFILNEKKDVDVKEILFGSSNFDMILTIIFIAFAIILLTTNNYFSKKINDTKDKDIDMVEYMNDKLYKLNLEMKELEKEKILSDEDEKL